MQIFHPTHQEFVFAMLDAGVDFILVGGYAVGYHGYVRYTGDMDLWLRPTNENTELFIRAMQKINMNPDDLAYIHRKGLEEMVMFHFGEPPERIDFMTKLAGLDYDKAFARREFLNLKCKHPQN